MPVPVVAIGAYVPDVPVLRSMMNLAVPSELSTQFNVSRASLPVPAATRVVASSTAPTIVQVVRLTTVRSHRSERLRDRGHGRGCGAVRERGGERERTPQEELEVLIVRRKDDEAATVGGGEAHGHGAGGVQQRPIEGGRDGQGPESGVAARVPRAGGVAVKRRGRRGPPSTRAQGRREGAVQGPIRGQGRIALAHAVAELAVVGQREGGGGRGHRGHRRRRGAVRG